MNELGGRTMRHFRLRTIAAFTMAVGIGAVATMAYLISLV